MRKNIIVIPAYNPPDRMVDYVKELITNRFDKILIINDGSREEFNNVFEKVSSIDREKITVYSQHKNMGKGRAMKDAFKLILDSDEGYTGIITVDSDGQHLVEDVVNISDTMESDYTRDYDEYNNTIYFGSRNFDLDIVPPKSKFGNKMTSKVFKYLYRADIGDTQTGLRGFPIGKLNEMINISGERFEYETNMLIYLIRKKINIKEIEITTHYIDENSESHFCPIVDSIKIYALIFGTFFGYLLSALTSAFVDFAVFQLILFLLSDVILSKAIWISTIVARIISSLYNYSVNRNIVFNDDKKIKNTIIYYYTLCIVQMFFSGFFVNLLTMVTGLKAIVSKVIVDGIIFFINYFIQKHLIFRKR